LLLLLSSSTSFGVLGRELSSSASFSELVSAGGPVSIILQAKQTKIKNATE
jgi:hypothetical protein